MRQIFSLYKIVISYRGETMKIIKTKNGVATVIEIEGRRYVLDMKGGKKK